MREITLVIMAAGIGSRFGTGIKQLESVGPNGELIIDYSIHDALEAGFNKVVFVIRKALEKDFKEIIGNRINRKVKVEYAYQEIEQGYISFPGRTKPWGTGQAVLACKDLVKDSFAVINADDYYGKEAFKLAADFLKASDEECAMIAYKLKNTLSENGGVTRGICSINDLRLTKVVETKNLTSEYENLDASVSMNFWCLQPYIFDMLEQDFRTFQFNKFYLGDEVNSGEFLMPEFINKNLRELVVNVLHTDSTWFGMTYKEDLEIVRASILEKIKEKDYPVSLLS